MIRLFALISGISSDRVRTGLAMPINEHGLIRLPFIIAFFIAAGVAGCCLGWMHG